jgi:hypothetical protein
MNISNNLKWNTNIQVLGSKLNNIFCMIASLGRPNVVYVKKYYFAKFESLIKYGIILWGGKIESVKQSRYRPGVAQRIPGS